MGQYKVQPNGQIRILTNSYYTCFMKQLLSVPGSYFHTWLIVVMFCGCQKPSDPLDSSKEIVSVSLKRVDGTYFTASEVTVVITGNTVNVTLPPNTERNGLTPEIVIKGKSISPASGVAQNFTQPITYTVTAADGSSVKYTVTVSSVQTSKAVYFGSSNNNFYAVDAASGTLLWKYSSTAPFTYSSPTFENNTVYVGGIDNYVYAFDAPTGTIKWQTALGSTGIESDAVVLNGTVYVGCNDDYLAAIDAINGAIKWRFSTGGNISASPTVANGTVYFGCSDNKLYAVDSATGKLKWSFATGAMINQSGPALVNGVIYVGSRDGYLYAVDALSGKQKWRFSAGGISLEQSSPTVANGIVYIGSWYDIATFSHKGSLYAVDATTGQLIWEKLQNTGISSSPCVANGRLYITTDDLNIYALDATSGATLWSKQILANGASAAVSNNTVYVGGGGTGYFYALDAATGAERWRFAVPGGLSISSPLIITSPTTADYSGDSGLLD